MSNFLRQVGAAIREKRTASGLTPAALAARVDRDAAYVMKVERGAEDIDLQTFERIFAALNARFPGTVSQPLQEPAARPAALALFNTIAKAMGVSNYEVHPKNRPASGRAVGPRQDHAEAYNAINPPERRLLEACLPYPQTAMELLEALGYKTRTGNYRVGLSNLLAMRLLKMTIPNRPRSPHQKYRLTAKGRKTLAAQRT